MQTFWVIVLVCIAAGDAREAGLTFSLVNLTDLISGPYLPPRPGSVASPVDDLAGCPCKQILVSALGNAQAVQGACMGVYTSYSTYNNFPAYNGPGGRRLYFLAGSGWLIGPSLGSPQGYIHNFNAFMCPYMIPAGWMYVSNGLWYQDDSLVVRCIQ